MKRCLKTTSGLTLTELLTLVVILGLLVVIVLPNFRKARVHISRIDCFNNLRAIGLGFRIYATDNDGLFPGAGPTNSLASWAQQPYSAYLHFKALSNELSAPLTVLCPEDKARSKTLTNVSQMSGNHEVSYFVGLLRGNASPSAILAGDRNLTNSHTPRLGFLQLSTNSALGWRRTNHIYGGNIAFADGRAEAVDSFRLNAAYKKSAGMPDRVALPISFRP